MVRLLLLLLLLLQLARPCASRVPQTSRTTRPALSFLPTYTCMSTRCMSTRWQTSIVGDFVTFKAGKGHTYVVGNSSHVATKGMTIRAAVRASNPDRSSSSSVTDTGSIVHSCWLQDTSD